MKQFFAFIALACLLAAMASSQTAIPSHAFSKVVIVNVTEPWTSTGIYVASGDTVEMIVKGIASSGAGLDPQGYIWVGPEGQGNLRSTSLPVPSASAHSLIGKIGLTGTPFFVGAARVFRANSSDTLYLGYNDGATGFFDNFGYYVAWIFHRSIFGTLSVGNGAISVPIDLRVSQNYPNPINPSTTISYVLPSRANVEVQIFDMSGRLVKGLVSEQQESGSHTVVWNGQDQAGHSVASGTYFYRVDSDGRQLAKKMLLLK